MASSNSPVNSKFPVLFDSLYEYAIEPVKNGFVAVVEVSTRETAFLKEAPIDPLQKIPSGG